MLDLSHIQFHSAFNAAHRHKAQKIVMSFRRIIASKCTRYGANYDIFQMDEVYKFT